MDYVGTDPSEFGEGSAHDTKYRNNENTPSERSASIGIGKRKLDIVAFNQVAWFKPTQRPFSRHAGGFLRYCSRICF